jgi:Serine dehydrogenase proteinase
MSRKERVEAIRHLQDVRGGTSVISYVTSTRPGLEAQMSMDVLIPFYRHLKDLPGSRDGRRIDLFLQSNGGDAIVPWKLVTLIRAYCEEFNVLVPYRAFSAATLTALGADSVVMHPMGMLGPTDPSITGPFNPRDPVDNKKSLPVSVEDVSSYIALIKEDVGIRHEDELIQAFLALAEKVHPLALGSVKRTTSQSRMLGEKLLSQRRDVMAPSAILEIVDKLTSKLYFHGHPINNVEAREEIGLHFVEAADENTADAMWGLFEVYLNDLNLEDTFDVKREAIAKNPLTPPPVMASLQPMQQLPNATVRLDPLQFAVVESATRTDTYEAECEITITRDQLGNYQNGQPQFVRQSWVSDTSVV